jgi:hypothetical protein
MIRVAILNILIYIRLSKFLNYFFILSFMTFSRNLFKELFVIYLIWCVYKFFNLHLLFFNVKKIRWKTLDAQIFIIYCVSKLIIFLKISYSSLFFFNLYFFIIFFSFFFHLHFLFWKKYYILFFTFELFITLHLTSSCHFFVLIFVIL